MNGGGEPAGRREVIMRITKVEITEQNFRTGMVSVP